MPLYMDRHDIQGITAEQVAQAHVLHLAASPRLSVHRKAHGLVSNDIIEVAEDSVLRFLGRIDGGQVVVPGFPDEVALYQLER